MLPKKRYAIAGTGVRSLFFAKALITDFSDCGELVGLFDPNTLRMRGFNQLLGRDVPMFNDFKRMSSEVRPTHLIIGTPDATHNTMIRLAFQAGMDVITEKPMATTPEKVGDIFAAEQEFSRSVRVAFNFRYTPSLSKIKEVLSGGDLGKPLTVSLDWNLGKGHGAEYFRRWHAQRENSGGLLVHKSTHHFDLINWLLDDEPGEVLALGNRQVFGPGRSQFSGYRCSTCQHAVSGACSFAMKSHKVPEDREIFEKLYWEAEPGDGYIRDLCVFRDEIDIFDTMSVLVKYQGGCQLSYSLKAYAPSSSYYLSIICEHGRIELTSRYSGVDMKTSADVEIINVTGGLQQADQKTTREIQVPVDKTSHGGADKRLFAHLFRDSAEDPLKQIAGSHAGAISCLMGVAANLSAESKRSIELASIYPK